MANLHSMRVQGNLVFWDTHRARWVDAIGPGVCKFVDDFVATHLTTDAPHGWTVTLTEAGAGESTIAGADGAGGLLLITSDAAEHDGVSMQVTKEAFKLASGKPCYFGIKLQSNDATQSKWMAGLCITDTEMLGDVSDGVYFEKLDGSTDINFVLEKNTNETTSASAVGTLADNTWVILEFLFDGTNVDCFVNGVQQTRLAITNLPDDEDLTPSLEFETGEANAATMTIDWVRCIQING